MHLSFTKPKVAKGKSGKVAKGKSGKESNSTKNELEVPLIDGELILMNFSPTEFNNPDGPLAFFLSGAEFGEPPYHFEINGLPVDQGLISKTNKTFLSVDTSLSLGLNDIRLEAVDSVGRGLFFRENIWAGVSSLTVLLRDIDGNVVTTPTELRLYLAEAQHVASEATTNAGSFTFMDLSTRTVIVEAKGSNGSSGTIGALPSGQSTIALILYPLYPISSVTNLDFTVGGVASLAGWDIETNPSSMNLVSHDENASLQNTKNEFNQGAFERTREEEEQLHPLQEASTLTGDSDLVLRTNGEGVPQYAHHQFPIPAGSCVKVRFRFQTEEFPVYYGTKFNDYYSVTLKSQSASGVATLAAESRSMNSLPYSAFTQGGYTEWREVKVPSSDEESTVQADLIVANVADGSYQSMVIVDYIEQIEGQVKPTIKLDSANGGLSLQYQVVGDSPLTAAVDINLYWVDGNDKEIGEAFHTSSVSAGISSVSAGKSPGPYGPINVPINSIAPADVKLIKATSGCNDFMLPDVKIEYGPNANSSIVSKDMISIIKAGLRNAGSTKGKITSTARTAEDQARVMFNNCVKTGKTVAQNIQDQYNIYAAPGDAVIAVFETMSAGKTREEVLAVATATKIKAAMLAEINNQGPSNVSKHCADPSIRCVVDVGAANLPGSLGQRFSTFIQSNIGTYDGKYIDERTDNNCFHLEIDV